MSLYGMIIMEIFLRTGLMKITPRLRYQMMWYVALELYQILKHWASWLVSVYALISKSNLGKANGLKYFPAGVLKLIIFMTFIKGRMMVTKCVTEHRSIADAMQ